MVPLHGTCLLEVRAASLGRQDSGGLILSHLPELRQLRDGRMYARGSVNIVSLCHNRFTPRSFACCHCFSWERGPTEKEEHHEKEGQEEESERNIKKWNARKARLSPPAARKA
jgi:hypothetical protein